VFPDDTFFKIGLPTLFSGFGKNSYSQFDEKRQQVSFAAFILNFKSGTVAETI
jgi:hypothetical protein